MDDNDAYIKDTTSNAGSKLRLMAVAAARARVLANNVLVSGWVAATRCTERESGDTWEVSGAVPARDEPDDRTHRSPNNRKVTKATLGKAAKNFVKAPSNKARDFAGKGNPTMPPLTMDNDDAYVRGAELNAVSKPCLMAAAAVQAKARTNNVLVSSQVAATHHTKPGDPWEVSGAVPARDKPKNRTHRLPSDRTHRLPTKASRGLGPPGDVCAPAGFSTAPGGNEEGGYDNISKQLPHGMANLWAAMAMEGTTACRFAEAIDASDVDNDWANEYGAFIASLHNEDTRH
jgi:hypothetical protein